MGRSRGPLSGKCVALQAQQIHLAHAQDSADWLIRGACDNCCSPQSSPVHVHKRTGPACRRGTSHKPRLHWAWLSPGGVWSCRGRCGSRCIGSGLRPPDGDTASRSRPSRLYDIRSRDWVVLERGDAPVLWRDAASGNPGTQHRCSRAPMRRSAAAHVFHRGNSSNGHWHPASTSYLKLMILVTSPPPSTCADPGP